MTNIPTGFEPWERTSPFLDAAMGPLHVVPDTMTFGIEVEERHTNTRGGVHGGLLATIADLSLGHTMRRSTDAPPELSTVSLSLDFVSAARTGDWLEASAEVLRLGPTTGFARCIVTSAERPVLRGSGVFAVAHRR